MVQKVSYHSIPIQPSVATTYALSKKEKALWLFIIRRYAQDFLKQAFGRTETLTIKLDARKFHYAGYFTPSDNSITFCTKYLAAIQAVYKQQQLKPTSNQLYTSQAFQTLEHIIRHELIHYVLYHHNLPYMDGTPVFESYLAQTKTVASLAIKEEFVVAQPKHIMVIPQFTATCSNCQYRLKTDTKGHYRCGKCKQATHVTRPLVVVTTLHHYGLCKDVTATPLLKSTKRVTPSIEQQYRQIMNTTKD